MWKIINNLKSYKELLDSCPSKYYSTPRIVENTEDGLSIEKNNNLVHIHTDEFWLQRPPEKLYLYCELSGTGGDTLLGNFSDLHYSSKLENFLRSFTFLSNRGNYNILSDDLYKLHHSHSEMISQIKNNNDIEIFSKYLHNLKKITKVIYLSPGQGLIVNNHLCFHGRLAFTGKRKFIKILGYNP